MNFANEGLLCVE